jgi:hypothetical protein
MIAGCIQNSLHAQASSNWDCQLQELLLFADILRSQEVKLEHQWIHHPALNRLILASEYCTSHGALDVRISLGAWREKVRAENTRARVLHRTCDILLTGDVRSIQLCFMCAADSALHLLAQCKVGPLQHQPAREAMAHWQWLSHGTIAPVFCCCGSGTSKGERIDC